ncbi:hypothetical protein [Amycolatopsis minnesotensis]|uniref:Uncharacterized protein n=1 Tax=Amycolatopsis minnesotensis TaxID=337894 RepID=A0ABN2R138_9PSEU
MTFDFTPYATHDVFYELRTTPLHGPHVRIGTTFNLNSEAEFRAEAGAWLRTRLPRETIDEANWPEVFDFFKTLADPQAVADVATDWATRPRSVRAVQLTEDNFQRVRAWIESEGGEVPWTGQSHSGSRSMAVDTVDGEHNAFAGDFVVHDQSRQEWRVEPADSFAAGHDLLQTGR